MGISLSDRLWTRVEKTETCWLWRGADNGKGYGRISTDKGAMYVHRLVYVWAFGEIPAGLLVMHWCDVRACVRPDHLSLGTAQDNTDDMISKGRQSNWRERLTECKSGHPFDEENTYQRQGGRACSVCRRQAVRRYQAKRKVESGHECTNVCRNSVVCSLIGAYEPS